MTYDRLIESISKTEFCHCDPDFNREKQSPKIVENMRSPRRLSYDRLLAMTVTDYF